MHEWQTSERAGLWAKPRNSKDGGLVVKSRRIVNRRAAHDVAQHEGLQWGGSTREAQEKHGETGLPCARQRPFGRFKFGKCARNRKGRGRKAAKASRDKQAKNPEFLLTRCALLLACQLAFRQREAKSPESFVGKSPRCDTGFFALGTGGAGDLSPHV